VADQRSNALLIGGGKDSFELVQSLARELDRAETALSGKIRLVPLQYADARAMVVSLTQLFAQRYTAARTPEMQRRRPVIVADPRANALLISAGVDDNTAIDDLLSKLDRKLEDPAMAVTVIALQHNDATRISTMLEGVFAARQRNRTVQGVGPQPTDTVEVQPESLNNSLIVYASKENLEIIQSLLEKIDVEPVAADGVIEMFTLEYADAQRVSAMLRTLVQQGLYRPGTPAGVGRGAGAAANRREALAVSVDPRSNTLIVSASPENLAVVKEVIKKVDTKDFAADGNVKIYELKHARASSLSTVLSQFFQAKRQGESQAPNAAERSIPVSVIPDDRSNTLLVTGSKEGFDVMDRLVKQLDAEDTMSRMNFRVFPLKRATATSLQPTLQRLFANRPPRVRGEPLDPITLVADAWVNALLVGASIEDMGMVAGMIEKLDSEMTDPGLAVQVLPLAKADARRVAQTIQALYREGTPGVALPVAVNPDERMNAIVVSAGEADLTRIKELVAKLDTDQVARVSEIRVVALKYARAETLSTILNAALNTKPASLSEQSPNTQSLLQFIARSEDGRQFVTSALKEGVLITPDARMNSLIVSAPVDYIDLLEQIIAKLDTSSPRQAKIKVFALQNADARQTAELLLNLFRLQQLGATTANQRSIQYTLVKPASDVRPGTEESLASAVIGSEEQSALSVTVDPRTNSLLVGGTDHYVALVEEIINALDSSTAQERRTEVIRLRNAQAPAVATAISTFLSQERQRVVQVLGQEAVGTAQRMLEREVAIVADQESNTLLLSASPRFFDEIRKIIDQLDEQRPQVLIQVLLAEVTLDSLGELGLEWTYKKDIGDGRTVGMGTRYNMRSASDWNAGIQDQVNNFANGYSAVMAGGDLQFLLRALQNDGRLEVLTRPQILTADNKPASINIGQRIPLITDSRVTPQNDTINSFRYEDVGVNLTVTPRISSDGFVSIEVGTTNSAVSSSTVEINKNATVPIINSRRANTTVNVQSGQTVVIGGLIATVDDTRTKKVPILGDVPGLGFLFRARTTQKDRKELLIMLTPQVLVHGKRIPEDMTLEAFSQQEMRQSGIKDQIRRDDLQKKLLEPFFPERKLTPEEMDPDPATPPSQPASKDKKS
jgi:type II secretion system protein D